MPLDGLISGGDALLVTVPLIAVLFMAIFRLDEVVCHRPRKRKRPAPRGLDEQGREIFNDPDGRRFFPR